MSMEIEKRAIIFHGTGETPDSIWIPYVKNGLEQKGYSVSVPQFPNKEERPELGLWLPIALKLSYTDRTVLIGHSAGSALALSVLERLKNVTIRQAILVAGFVTPNDLDVWVDGTNPMLQESYDWEKIRSRVGQVVCLNSDNDPYGCNDKKGQEIVDGIGADQARLIVMKGQGHMGSDFSKQPYREFPFLLDLVE